MLRFIAIPLLALSVLAPISSAKADGVRALRAAEAGNWPEAQKQAGKGTAREVVHWMYLMDDDTRASFPEIASFVTQHPDWPGADKLFKIAETRLPSDLTDGQIAAWFQRNPPVSGVGMKRYMAALLRNNQTQQAMTSLKTWWVEANLSSSEQDDMIASYGQYLGTPDHVRRLQRILTAKQYTVARALAPRMGRGYPELVEARIALQDGGKGVEARMSQIPNSLLKDTGLMLSRVQYRRQNNLDAEAIALLAMAPPASQTTDPADWWKERNILTRRMIEAKRYREAYQLASHSGLTPESSPADYAAAEFVSGWLALRFTNQPYKAFEHFERMFNNVQTPISRSRAAYWAGRASEAMRSNDVAMQWYQVAARYQTTFYGQQAAQRIGLPLNLIKGDKPPVSQAVQANFDSSDLAQATKLLHRAGLQKQRTMFLRAMMKNAKSPQDYSMLADFSMSMGQLDMTIKIAKEAEKSGLYLIDYLFPTITQTVGNRGVDPALVHAFIRQESQFDPNAVSSAGALGLMQIMPATGTHTAKKNGIMHNTSWLTAKPEHNVQIGTFYIQELLKKYNGCMPLVISAYNAGPGRANQWMNAMGNPCSGQVDMIDWMESIPIYETRNYVQRVMEGYAVYSMKMAKYNGNGGRAFNTAYNP